MITELTVQVRPAPGGADLRRLAAGDLRARARRRCGGWSRTARPRPCCGSPTRPRRRSGSPAPSEIGSAPTARRLPGHRRLRGHRRGRRGAACGRRRSCCEPPGPTPVAGRRRGLGARALPRALPARRAARRRRARRDARDGHLLVARCAGSTPRSPTALRESLTAQGTPPVILCHVSHVYPAGASLYFTVACAQLHDPVAQWRRAKARRQRRDPGRRRLDHPSPRRRTRPPRVATSARSGELGIAVLQAVKRTLDPAGILNPGVLIHDTGSDWHRASTTRSTAMSSRSNESEHVAALAELVVRFGANVQPGQILAISSEPGKEALARAIAEAAYARGALFVDLSVFDVHLKRARALHADRDTLGFVPPWIGARALALGEHRCARVALTGPVAPRIMDGVDPTLLGLDMLPSLPRGDEGDQRAHHQLDRRPRARRRRGPRWCTRGSSRRRRWSGCGSEVAHVCRLDEPDPIAAWNERLDQLTRRGRQARRARPRRAALRGPGHRPDDRPAPEQQLVAARFETVDGIVHAPNIPTEEVFTTPDPERVDGIVTATKPLFTSGTTISGLQGPLRGRPGGRDRRRPGRRGAPRADRARPRRGAPGRGGAGRPRGPDRAAGHGLLRHAARRERRQPHRARPGLRARRRATPSDLARVNESRSTSTS